MNPLRGSPHPPRRTYFRVFVSCPAEVLRQLPSGEMKTTSHWATLVLATKSVACSHNHERPTALSGGGSVVPFVCRLKVGLKIRRGAAPSFQ